MINDNIHFRIYSFYYRVFNCCPCKFINLMCLHIWYIATITANNVIPGQRTHKANKILPSNVCKKTNPQIVSFQAQTKMPFKTCYV